VERHDDHGPDPARAGDRLRDFSQAPAAGGQLRSEQAVRDQHDADRRKEGPPPKSELISADGN